MKEDAMDILQQWADDYNTVAHPAVPLRSGGEAGGAQLRLRYRREDGQESILHAVAVNLDGRPVMLLKRFDGPMPETAVQAGLWASEKLGRRQSG
ncbi:MAG: hypothetical protein H0W30_07020 [Gemmatimonadaceae bacterium]|nr:hypothetical protein [Gemmatimonadaceae bacterium]MDQ3518480.1 hypothetical protein [Gemmatimonadota bacterium]